MEKKLIKLDNKININSKKQWKFDSSVVSTFDSHINKSVPNYADSHNLILSLAKDLLSEKSKVLDIGCSTGTLLYKLYKEINFDLDLVGIDISKDMINFAKKNIKHTKIKFFNCGLSKFKQSKFDFIISFYTLQFMHSTEKKEFLVDSYKKLNSGGHMIVFDKVTEESGWEQKIFQSAYDDFKRHNEFSNEEIYNKTEKLRGVLHPNSRKENYKIFKEINFKSIFLLSKNLFFEGYLLKK